ncbi:MULTISPECIES: type III polyketide synthase [unclassified Sphingomonas]|uniref:type III polyketide synthase n=1 Tax=unclassified Sphingomonas TaxID=196159 RepID=UPI000829947A|nr:MULTISPECIES: type III polyketide synthase [unclassified Sphingomonas]
MTAVPHINAIGTAVPGHDVHASFIAWAEARLSDPRLRGIFRRMAGRSGIRHRWSVLPYAPGGGSPVDHGGFYNGGGVPGTARRMAVYAEQAPALARAAVDALAVKHPPHDITHLVVASCTGFVAPGIDQLLAADLGLSDRVERVLVGFMGCYAAVAALRTASHIVRSEPGARVLVVTVELSSLHLQYDDRIEPLLAMLQFGDGAAAALVTGDAAGFAIDRRFSLAMPDSGDLITWTVGDAGFIMELSGEVPGRIAAALGDARVRDAILGDRRADAIDAWAVHAGGRSILDAVGHGLGLAADGLDPSRRVLERFGNMSSSTLMFVLADMLDDPAKRCGIGMAFGPGLAVEGFGFHRAP